VQLEKFQRIANAPKASHSERNRFPFANWRDNMKRILFLVALLTASTCWAQELLSNLQQSLSQDQALAPESTQDPAIVIPVGTRIPLSLASPIAAKSARPGYAVRAVTGFPVTVGTQLAIPVGAYVEGVIDKVTKGGSSGRSLQMHFTRILYANGYSVTVDGANAVARALSPDSNSPEIATFSIADASLRGSTYAPAAQQLPGQPPMQPPTQPLGPHFGAAIAAGVAAMAAGIVVAVLLARHGGGGNGILFDTGWQFEMVLKSPVSVNAASIAGAVAPSGAR
jgi:hypothetical protein